MNRLRSFDVLKGIACIAVVIIHYNFPGNLGYAVKSMSRFAVPIFFIISGYFLVSSKENGRISASRIAHKLRHSAAILFVSSIFYSIFTLIFNNILNSSWSLEKYSSQTITATKILKLFITNDPLVYAHLWYLLALIYCYLLMLFFEKKRIAYIGIWLAPILLVSYASLQEFGAALHIKSSVQIAGADSLIYLYNLFIFRALPFFLFGCCLHEWQTRVEQIQLPYFISIMIILFGCILSIVERFLFREAQFYIGTYISVFFMIVVAINVPIPRSKISTFFEYIGKNLSLYVYVLHIAVGKSMDLAANKLLIHRKPWYIYGRCLIILTISLIISLFIHQVYLLGKERFCCYEK